MMDIEKLIEDLRGLLKQYGEKTPYGELVGAPWPYSRAGDLVWPDPEPYFIEQAATALSTLQAENEKLRAELEQVKRDRDSIEQDFRAFTKQWLEEDSGFPCRWGKFERQGGCEWKAKQPNEDKICAYFSLIFLISSWM